MGLKQTRGLPTLTSVPREGLPIPGLSPMLSIELSHFRKISLGVSRLAFAAPAWAASSEPSSFGLLGDPACLVSVFNPHLLMMEGSRHWPAVGLRLGSVCRTGGALVPRTTS